MGLQSFRYSFATAVGLFKNILGLSLLLLANFTVKRLGESEHALW